MDIINSIERKKSNAVIFPEEANIFNAFNLTPFNKAKVVIIGQGALFHLFI
jgi:uracil-DNA glycosylase